MGFGGLTIERKDNDELRAVPGFILTDSASESAQADELAPSFVLLLLFGDSVDSHKIC